MNAQSILDETTRSAISLLQIISGGQTGVDRGALDAALELDFPCGGWCPGDRTAEDGIIPDRYPLQVLPHGSLSDRTWQNVRVSGATLFIYYPASTNGGMTGGTRETYKACGKLVRRCLVVNARTMPLGVAIQRLINFLAAYPVAILNVAGPRASRWAQGHDYTVALLSPVLRAIQGK